MAPAASKPAGFGGGCCCTHSSGLPPALLVPSAAAAAAAPAACELAPQCIWCGLPPLSELPHEHLCGSCCSLGFSRGGPAATAQLGRGRRSSSCSNSSRNSGGGGAGGGPQGAPATLASLPGECLALIACLLERPDRECLALACQAGRAAVSTTVMGLAPPLASLTQDGWGLGEQCGGGGGGGGSTSVDSSVVQLLRRHIGARVLRLSGCAVCGAVARPPAASSCTEGHQALVGVTDAVIATLGIGAGRGQAWPLQAQRRIGVALAPWEPPAALAAAAPRPGTRASGAAAALAPGPLPLPPPPPPQQQQQQQQQGDAAPAGPHSGPPLPPPPALVSWVAAAGSCLPHLAHLDLSGVCLHGLTGSAGTIPGGLLAAVRAGCPNLATLSLPGWLWQGLGTLFAEQLVNRAIRACGGFAGMPADRERWVRAQLQAGLDQAFATESLGHLAGLTALRALRLSGAPAPTEVLQQLALLTQLSALSLNAGSDAPLPAAGPAAFGDSGAAGGGGGGGATVLGSALLRLRGLTQLALSHLPAAAAACLGQLGELPALNQLSLRALDSLKVQDFGRLSAATGLRMLRLRECRPLLAKSRAALPMELTCLCRLATAIFDFDLHLRDVQMLSRLPELTLLGADNLHGCVNMHMGQLSLPQLKQLALSSLPMPTGPMQQGLAAAAAAQAGHEQQQQQQPPPLPQPPAALVFWPAAMMPPGAGMPGSAPVPLPYPAGTAAWHPGPVPAVQLMGMPQLATQLLQLQQQQLLIVQQQQQQQQQYQQQPAWLPQPAAVPPPAPLPLPVGVGAQGVHAPAPALMPAARPGWLAVLCPALEELLVGSADPSTLDAISRHPTITRLLLGSCPSPRGGVGLASEAVLAEAWGALKTLPKLQALKINNSSLVPLCGLPHGLGLTSLQLKAASAVDDRQAGLLASRCRGLRQLQIEDAQRLTDGGLRHLSALSELTHLVLTTCPSITRVGLRRLLLASKSLQHMELSACAGVPACAAQQLEQAVRAAARRTVVVTWRSGKAPITSRSKGWRAAASAPRAMQGGALLRAAP